MVAKPIPFLEAEKLAKAYGYDQLVIIARRIGEQGGAEVVITYGAGQEHKTAVEDMASRIKRKLLGWPER